MSASVTARDARGDLVADARARRATCGTDAGRHPGCRTLVPHAGQRGQHRRASPAPRCAACGAARRGCRRAPRRRRRGPDRRGRDAAPASRDRSRCGRRRGRGTSSRPLYARDARRAASRRRPGRRCDARDERSAAEVRRDRAASSTVRVARARSRPGRTPRRRAPRRAGIRGIRRTRAGSGATNAPSGAAPMEPSARVDVGRIRRSEHDPAARGLERADRAQHLVALRERDERTHRDAVGARVADDDALGDLRPQRLDERLDGRPSGTMARRIAVHFWPAFVVSSTTSCFDVGVELRACPARRRARAPTR